MSCAVLVTPGHCASSLAMHKLSDDYIVGPPGPIDGYHPFGHYDWMELLGPQIRNDWDAYAAAVKAQKRPFAFKLQSGIIHWGAEALAILPAPVRIIVLHRREGRHKIAERSGEGWVRSYRDALGPFLAHLAWHCIPFEIWNKEDL